MISLLVPLIPLLERPLPLPIIPIQRAADTAHPILASAFPRHHVGERIPAGADGDVIARVQLDALAAVEAGPAGGAGVVGDADAEDDGVREDDGAEGEGVRADGGDEDDGVFRVAEGAAGGEVVGRGAGWGGDADAVGLDRGHEFFVHEEFGAGHCWFSRSTTSFFAEREGEREGIGGRYLDLGRDRRRYR